MMRPNRPFASSRDDADFDTAEGDRPARPTDALAVALAAVTDLPRVVASLERKLVLLTAEVEKMGSRLPSPVVPVQQAAEVLGCSVLSIRRRIRSGEIPVVRVGRAVRVDLSKIRARNGEKIAEITAQIRAARRMGPASEP